MYAREHERRFERRPALADRLLHLRFVVDAGFLVVAFRLARADLREPVLQVVRGFVGVARRLHLHLKHRAQLRHRILPRDADLLHFGEQHREPAGHVDRLERTFLAEIRDRLQRLEHRGRILDVRVLLQRLNHLRRLDARRTLADRELRDGRRKAERPVDVHPGRHHLVHRLGQFVAVHPVGRCIASNPVGHRALFARARDARLDRDVADDRLILRRHHRRHRDRGGQLHRIADRAAHRLPAAAQALVPHRAQFEPARGAAKPRIRAIKPVHLDAGVAQRPQIRVQLAPDRLGRTVARTMQAAELVL